MVHTVSAFNPKQDYKLQIRLKLSGCITKKVFHFRAADTFVKSIEKVSNQRLPLKEEYIRRGTLKPEKVKIAELSPDDQN